jgi:hypothetical protein
MPFLFIPKPLDKNFMVFIMRYRGLPKVREQSSLLPFSNTLKSGLAPFEERKRLCNPLHLPHSISFICLFNLKIQFLAFLLQKEPEVCHQFLLFPLEEEKGAEGEPFLRDLRTSFFFICKPSGKTAEFINNLKGH